MLLSALVQGDDAATALVRSDGRTLSYAALREAAEAGGRQLVSQQLGTGDVVGVALVEPAEFLLAAVAVWKSGAALLPLDVRGGRALWEQTAQRARVAGVVTGLQPDLSLAYAPREGAERVDERAGLVLFTSGSTGPPRGVVLSRDGVAANVEAICDYLPLAAHPRTAVVQPLFHVSALVGQVLTTLRAGGALVLLSDLVLPRKQLEAMSALAASGLSAPPATLRQLARTWGGLEPRPPLALGYVASAGSALDAATVREVRAALAPARFFNQYGLTEASPRVTWISDADPGFDRGSVGRALPGVEVAAFADDGQPLPAGAEGALRVRGPSVMLGYQGDDAATRAAVSIDGWLTTGDRGHVDAQGQVFVAGRADGVVKVAGERVGLESVASALRAAKGVDELAVVALPDDVLGARLVAAATGAEDLEAAVRELARERLPPVMRPSRILRVDALPRTAGEKIDGAALESLVRAALDR